jgi:competence/damage-inducible protein CinA-like protein
MPTSEIITIGTEILLGEIVDTNARHIARRLRAFGIDIYRTMSIGDNPARIAEVVKEAFSRADIIITTGGLGPTVDDPTREAIAQAFGVPVIYHEKLWAQVVERFSRFNRYPTENNKKQAYIPQGALPIENPVGTAPAFLMETARGAVISLPGVPREMEYLLDHHVLPYLQARFNLTSLLKVRILHTAGVGESQIDERISDLEGLANPTIGLAAHSGQVDVRISAKATTEHEADEMIQVVERDVRERLGAWIYGADEETLVDVAMRKILAQGWQVVALEAGLGGRLLSVFSTLQKGFLRGESLPSPPADPSAWLPQIAQYRELHNAEIGLAVALYPAEKTAHIELALITPDRERALNLPYGGPPQLAGQRAVNYGLDLLRKI